MVYACVCDFVVLCMAAPTNIRPLLTLYDINGSTDDGGKC